MGGVGKQGNRCDRCDKIIIGKERKEVSYHIILSKKPLPTLAWSPAWGKGKNLILFRQ